MGLSKPYLLLYNLVQAFGWGYILYLELLSSARSGDVGYFLQIFQTLALLEVFHACFRLVRSSPLTTIIQLSSRIFVVWAVLYLYPEVKVHSKVFKMMVVSWCLAEITRYCYYFACLLFKPPFSLTYLRYSLFMILYPTGILGELLLILLSLSYVSKRSPIDFPMPNRLNVALHGYCVYWIVLIMYLPFSPVMYKHMLAQRRKVLGSPTRKNV
uniref:Very-long-chain (3R)-3-hydroxyacyl-CoA dehydratase n=2 Tax=Schistocephalus solidus TaxID=70667 RepID=A0A0X3Q0W9_SCHSO